MAEQELAARIRCTSETRDRLRRLKVGAERYEEVLKRLLREHEENA